MAVTPDDVRHVASLARLGLTPEALQAYVAANASDSSVSG